MSTISDTLNQIRHDNLTTTRREGRLLRERRRTLNLIKLRERIDVRPIRKHYYQSSANRLFVTHSSEQSEELRRLCGKAISFMDVITVEWRRVHQPFADEIDLKR